MFETMTAVKDELRKLKMIHESNGQAGLNLTDNLRLAAVECTKLLRPYTSGPITAQDLYWVARDLEKDAKFKRYKFEALAPIAFERLRYREKHA
jgi:hypothetical protein